MEIYWTIVAGILSAVWALVTFIRDRTSQATERSRALIGRLIENDHLHVEHPEVQQFIAKHAQQHPEWFRRPEILDETLFFQAKAIVYTQLNMYDEILSASAANTGFARWFSNAEMVELADWENYIRQKLRHPLYRSTLNHEIDIFGESLRSFWRINKAHIEAQPVDPYMW